MLLLVLAGLAPVAPPPSAAANTAPPAIVAESDRPSEAEALAFVQAYAPSALRRESELRILRENFLPTLRKNSDSAAMLKAFPALGRAMVEALAGNIDIYMAEYDARFLPRAAAIVRAGLTRRQALELTTFYRSPVGQRALRAAASHIDGSEVAQAGLEGRPIDAGIARRQMLTAGWGALAELSPEDRASVMAQVGSPTGKSFRAIAPKLAALQMEFANDPGPQFKARSEHAMGDAFKRITGLQLPTAQ
jgi:hypothetical protein